MATPHDMPADKTLDRILALDEVSADTYRSVEPDRNLNGEVFGGQYLGLSIAAAMRGSDGRPPHAMLATFLRGAQAADPLDYKAERTRDGRTFAHRRITAVQHGREVFRAEVSLHDWEDGELEHAARMPDVPPPEALVSLRDHVRRNADTLDDVTVRRVLGRTSFDSYFMEPGLTVGKCADGPAITAWVRPNDPPPPDDPAAFYATLAYLSDACGNFACRALHTPSIFDGSTAAATLNHAIWFHSRPRPFEWILFVNESPFAGGGLGINRGLMYSRDGHLLASIVQEALIRRTDPARS